MQAFINSSFKIGNLTLANRLIQGPLAGFSCAPFRELFQQFAPPAYCVSEMISANDVLTKHSPQSRYLYRSAREGYLSYQIAGRHPKVMAEAAKKLADLGADLIDINCGCPKLKIRKKGAGSALLENPNELAIILTAIRQAIQIPFTVKIRIQNNQNDFYLAKMIEDLGVDALIVHGRQWTQDYDKPCDFLQIARIKQQISIPVIANGDVMNCEKLAEASRLTACDAFMISRAGTGKPWLYQQFLQNEPPSLDLEKQKILFLAHLQGLASLEDEHKAVLQSRSLIRYYFAEALQLESFYRLENLAEVERWLDLTPPNSSPHLHSIPVP